MIGEQRDGHHEEQTDRSRLVLAGEPLKRPGTSEFEKDPNPRQCRKADALVLLQQLAPGRQASFILQATAGDSERGSTSRSARECPRPATWDTLRAAPILVLS